MILTSPPSEARGHRGPVEALTAALAEMAAQIRDPLHLGGPEPTPAPGRQDYGVAAILDDAAG